MDTSEIQTQIIRLGKLLVEELSREVEYPDTLSRWMAHYVAEQIVAAESANATEKSDAKKRCFQTILALWKHRSSLPSGHRPFENFETILHGLERLDPEAPQPFYHHLMETKETTPEPGSVRDLMDFVVSIDSATRILIEAAMAQATAKAIDERTLALLKVAISQRHDEVNVIRHLVEKWENGQVVAEDRKARAKKQLEDRIIQLDAFCVVAKNVRNQFEDQLKTVS